LACELVEAVIAKRVERLDKMERAILELASVEGDQFTAQVIAEIISYPEKKIVYEHAVYDASVLALVNVIHNVDDRMNQLMLVGHNPGFTSLINYLADKNLDNLPTAGLYGMEFSISRWNEVTENSGKAILYEYPKKYKS